MKEIFIKWLKLNNCYEQYMFNFNEQNFNLLDDEFDEFIDKYNYNNYNYISFFWWDKTKEGYEYWKKLNINWAKFFNHIIKIDDKCYYCKNICKLEKLN